MACWCVKRAQSERFGTTIVTETVNKVDLSRRPFKIWSDSTAVEADTVIIATGKVSASVAI
jgi:thioredoxin reductase (NADPH)